MLWHYFCDIVGVVVFVITIQELVFIINTLIYLWHALILPIEIKVGRYRQKPVKEPL